MRMYTVRQSKSKNPHQTRREMVQTDKSLKEDFGLLTYCIIYVTTLKEEALFFIALYTLIIYNNLTMNLHIFIAIRDANVGAEENNKKGAMMNLHI